MSILVIFTVEYLLRLFTAPRKFHFISKPLNIIDFLAIAPNYVELIVPFVLPTTELRVLRLLRLSRALRLFMLFRYTSFFKRVFQYHGTIFEAITPIILFLGLAKVGIIFLESRHLWVEDSNLEQLFAIIGFALGIILAEKIGMTHTKFWQVENASIEIYAVLTNIRDFINRNSPKKGTEIVRYWTKTFLQLLHDPKADNFRIVENNEAMYGEIAKIDPNGSSFVYDYYQKLLSNAFFCLAKKDHLTPHAYDTLLHQSTVLYILLIAIFIPGLTGLISVLVATYVLYGMYYLTQDMDTIIAGEFSLINIRTNQLEKLAAE